MTHLKTEYFSFDQCDVINIANKKSTIPAGRHLTSENSTANGGVTIRPLGASIDISLVEWKRLQELGLVRE